MRNQNIWFNKLNTNNLQTWIVLNLNQVVELSKEYPVWELVWSEFYLEGRNKIIDWSLSIQEVTFYGKIVWASTALTTLVWVEPTTADDLNPWEYFINYTTWRVYTKWIDNTRVLFTYKVDNEVSGWTISEENTTSRYSYNVEWNTEYEGQAAVWSTEADLSWVIRKYTYDVSQNLLSITYSNWTDKKNVAWDDRLTLTYS